MLVDLAQPANTHQYLLLEPVITFLRQPEQGRWWWWWPDCCYRHCCCCCCQLGLLLPDVNLDSMFHGQGARRVVSGLAAARAQSSSEKRGQLQLHHHYKFPGQGRCVYSRKSTLVQGTQDTTYTFARRPHLQTQGGQHAKPSKPGVLPSVCKQSAHRTTPTAVLSIRVQNISKKCNYSSFCGCWNTRMLGTSSWTTGSIRWPVAIHN